MQTAAAPPEPAKARLAYFRELRSRLDPASDPLTATSWDYVDQPRSVSTRIAAELALAPTSSHLLIGGVGSGKTTELLAARDKIVEVEDVKAFYVDVSKLHDIAKMVPGAIAVQVGLTLAASIEGSDVVQDARKRLDKIAHGYWEDWHPDDGDGDGYHVPGILISPEQIEAKVEEAMRPLHAVLAEVRDTARHVVVMLDGLDRMTDVQAFDRLVQHDVKALTAAGIGVVLVGPLRALYGLDRAIIQRFDSFHYQPWLDVSQGLAGRTFLVDVLKRRIPESALDPDALDQLVMSSGGVLRDLLTLTQSACVETYLNGADKIGESEVNAALDTFGRKHMQGLRAPEIEVLQRVRTSGAFVQTSEDDLALLMTRRVLEYRSHANPRYAVHPTIAPLLREIGGR